jgi:hypothetical protein
MIFCTGSTSRSNTRLGLDPQIRRNSFRPASNPRSSLAPDGDNTVCELDNFRHSLLMVVIYRSPCRGTARHPITEVQWVERVVPSIQDTPPDGTGALQAIRPT